MERKTSSNITSTTVEDDTGYQSTLAFILLTDVVDGRSIYEDMNRLSDNELNEKIKNVIRYTFRRRVLDELYGTEVGSGDLTEKSEGLSDKRWNAVIKRSDLNWEEYRKYAYKFEKDKCKGFFVSGKRAEVDMFFAEYSDKVSSDSGALIYTKDGRKIPLSSGLLHRIDTIFEIGEKPGVSLTERMKKKSFDWNYKTLVDLQESMNSNLKKESTASLRRMPRENRVCCGGYSVLPAIMKAYLEIP
jgi:hypothetical protein